MREIIKDTKFRNGFMITHTNGLITKNVIKVVNYMNTALIKPNWKIAQWCSKYNLANGIERITDDYAYIYEDIGKALKVYPLSGQVSLYVRGSKEYEKPRIDGEGWPHLLLEQDFRDVKLEKIKDCEIEIDFSFEYFKNYMAERNNLHTAQFQWFFSITNKNSKSKGFNDFFWFGLSFIDFPRYDYPPSYEAVDGGKEEHTNKFICIVDSKDYLKEPVEIGKKVCVKYNIKNHIITAFKKAKEKGYLLNCKFEDMEISSMNVGWEVTGTFDVGLIIEKISCKIK